MADPTKKSGFSDSLGRGRNTESVFLLGEGAGPGKLLCSGVGADTCCSLRPLGPSEMGTPELSVTGEWRKVRLQELRHSGRQSDVVPRTLECPWAIEGFK